ncbi:hypothetical protein GDO86_016670 [Hymenochirus boettgeri]|nr:hypothetical protein GDO86_016670 [Hymenochirus boettgeri]
MVGLISKKYLTSKFSLQDVNGKSWSSDQAALFFNDIVSTETNLSSISASVLQGYTCGTNGKISNDKIQSLAKAMKSNNAILSEDQLNCLTRQVIKNGQPADLTSYPNEMYMFLSPPNNTNSTSCKSFYSNVGAANITILTKGSSRRKDLLKNCLSCLNITGNILTDDNVQVLGNMTCDLSGAYIENSTINILTPLAQCVNYPDDQKNAIQKMFTQGKTPFGSSSTWTKSTMDSLKLLPTILPLDTLRAINSSVLASWFKDTTILDRKQKADIVKAYTSNRARRAAGCTSQEITADNVKDSSLPLSYPAAQLDACLSNQTLLDYLSDLSSKAFTDDQLGVLKARLDQIYPGGYPGNILLNLGAITNVTTPADIAKWNISIDALSALLSNGLSSSVAKAIIDNYSAGNLINAPALNAISSKYICLLSTTQIGSIPTGAVGDAKVLDINPCSQAVKDQMYLKANASYQNMINDSNTYYNLMKPYLGGAPASDLKYFASKNISMDIGTFLTLNPISVTNLSVSDVAGLLGSNTIDIKSQVTSPVVQTWLASVPQSALDTLGLNLTSGMSVPTAATTIAGSGAPATLSNLLLITLLVALFFS